MGQRLDRLFNKNLGDVVVYLARCLRIALLAILGYVAWAGLVGDVFPPGQKTLEKIKEHPWWFTLITLATIYVAAKTDEWIAMFRPVGPDDQIANYRELATQRIYTLTKGPYADSDFRHATEQLLFAAQMEIEKALNLGNGELQTNLLWYTSHNTVEVVARSRAGDCPVPYPWNPLLMACQAMDQNRPIVLCNVRTQPGFENKPYDCVCAVPIAHRSQAFGAITVDSKGSKALLRKEAILDRILRPYAAILLLTRDKNSPYHACPQRTVR